MSILKEDFDFVRHLVKDQAGVAIDEGKDYLVESRLNALLRETEHDTLDSLITDSRDRSRSAFRDQLDLNNLVNETFFFWDGHPFETLEDAILPELIEVGKDRRELSIWSADCATGQEPYSVSMLIADHFQWIGGWMVWIRGSDYSEQSIEKPRLGVYSAVETSRGLSDDQRARYFTTAGGAFQINSRIRAMTEFFRHNLSRPWPADGQKDMILLRNVLIYFEESARRKILERM